MKVLHLNQSDTIGGGAAVSAYQRSKVTINGAWPDQKGHEIIFPNRWVNKNRCFTYTISPFSPRTRA